MDQKELFREVREAIDEINRRLAHGWLGGGATPSRDELAYIRDALAQVGNILMAGKLGDTGTNELDVGLLIIKSEWDYRNDPFSQKLFAIDDAYRRLVRSAKREHKLKGSDT